VRPVVQVVGAFVTFNCVGSVERCLEDYAGSGGWFRHHFQPMPLRFDGKHRLTVMPAPEPSDVVWTNVEVSPQQRSWRIRGAYALMAVVLLLSTCACIAVGSEERMLSDDLPSERLCDVQLPAAMFNSYNFPRDVALIESTAAVPNATTGAGAAVNGTACPRNHHRFTYVSSAFSSVASWTPPPSDAVRAALANGTLAPQPCSFSHCVSLSSGSMCTVPLSGDTFPLSTLAACFCSQYISTISRAIAAASDSTSSAVCSTYIASYVRSQVLGSAVTLVLVIINGVLGFAVRAVTRLERHMSVSEASHHLIVKLFIAEFVNTGLVVLLVNAKMPMQLPYPLSTVLGGTIALFAPDWYRLVGATIPITVVIDTITARFPELVSRLLEKRRWRQARRAVASQTALNVSLEPTDFEITEASSSALFITFIAMTYAPAFPIMYPIASVVLAVQFWIRKVRRLRCRRVASLVCVTPSGAVVLRSTPSYGSARSRRAWPMTSRRSCATCCRTRSCAS
jgi:hypothetical protein